MRARAERFSFAVRIDIRNWWYQRTRVIYTNVRWRIDSRCIPGFRLLQHNIATAFVLPQPEICLLSLYSFSHPHSWRSVSFDFVWHASAIDAWILIKAFHHSRRFFFFVFFVESMVERVSNHLNYMCYIIFMNLLFYARMLCAECKFARRQWKAYINLF